MKDCYSAHANPEAHTGSDIPESAVPQESLPSIEPAPKSGSLSISRQIGEGGNAMIWEAVQHSLGRAIAVKSLKRRKLDKSTNAQRLKSMFHQEARLTALLEHPNIVPVHDLGEDDEGMPLLAMKLVKGRPWSAVITEDFDEMPPEEFYTKHIQILTSVANATAFAHSHGIIHRDLKPSQVMLGKFGEVLLMDWGLAMTFKRDVGRATLGKRPFLIHAAPNPAGTPAYMAPEQTWPDESKMGPWTDVYLLGAMLYELLTGRAPHAASSNYESFKLASIGMIVPIQQAIGRDIPNSLHELALKSMDKDPANRPQSVEEFIHGITNYMNRADDRRESMGLVSQAAELIAASEPTLEVFSEALHLLDQSLLTLPGNPLARQMHTEVLISYAHTAMNLGYLQLAKAQVERIGPSEEKSGLLRLIEEHDYCEQLKILRTERSLERAEVDRSHLKELLDLIFGDFFSQARAAGQHKLVLPFIQKALAYLDTMETDSVDNSSLDYAYDCYGRLIEVCEAAESTDLAAVTAEKARALSSERVRYEPRNPERLRAYYRACDRLADVIGRKGDVSRAGLLYTEASEVCLAASSVDPDNPAHKAAAALIGFKIGEVYAGSKNVDSAADWLGAALQLLGSLPDTAMPPSELEELKSRASRLMDSLPNRDDGTV